MLPGLPQNNSPHAAPDQAPQPSFSFTSAVGEKPEDDAEPAYLDEPDYTPDNTNSLSIPAGYTYICQFIAHDIIADSHFHIGGRQTSARLNLDSMYGNDGRGNDDYSKDDGDDDDDDEDDNDPDKNHIPGTRGEAARA